MYFLVSWKIFPLSLISWDIISLCPGVRSIFIILHETYCSSSTWEMTFNITFSLWIVPLLSFILSSGIHIYIKLFILFSLMHAKKKKLFIFMSVLDLWQSERKVHRFLIHLCPYTCIASPVIIIIEQNFFFKVKDDSMLIYQNHSNSIVYFRVHSWWCTLYGFGQKYSDIYLSLYCQAKYFQCPKNPLCSAYSCPSLLSNHWYCHHSVAFYRILYGWNHIPCSISRLASFTE